jgi:hypothetical protein
MDFVKCAKTKFGLLYRSEHVFKKMATFPQIFVDLLLYLCYTVVIE